MGGVLYCLKIETRKLYGLTRGAVRLKNAGSMLEERIDVSVVNSNVHRPFCVFLVMVWKLFWGHYSFFSGGENVNIQ